MVRSDLWNPERFAHRSEVPTMGQMLEAHTGGKVSAEAYDSDAVETVPNTLY
jgi:hypothetical protein